MGCRGPFWENPRNTLAVSGQFCQFRTVFRPVGAFWRGWRNSGPCVSAALYGPLMASGGHCGAGWFSGLAVAACVLTRSHRPSGGIRCCAMVHGLWG